MMAVFYLSAKTPFPNDSLISLVMDVITDGSICFNIVSGISSSSQHFDGILLIILSTWSSIIFENLVSLGISLLVGLYRGCLSKISLIDLILLMKYCANLLANPSSL